MLLISRTKNLETSNFQAESWVNPFRKYSNSDKGDSDHRKTFFHNLEIFFFKSRTSPPIISSFVFAQKLKSKKKGKLRLSEVHICIGKKLFFLSKTSPRIICSSILL